MKNRIVIDVLVVDGYVFISSFCFLIKSENNNKNNGKIISSENIYHLNPIFNFILKRDYLHLLGRVRNPCHLINELFSISNRNVFDKTLIYCLLILVLMLLLISRFEPSLCRKHVKNNEGWCCQQLQRRITNRRRGAENIQKT